MKDITTDKINELRRKTGIGLMSAKKALVNNDGDMNKALDELRKKGEKITQEKADRTTGQGIVEAYVHSNNKVASLVAVLCETDFVERTEDFKKFAHELALQVAATKPKYLSPEDVPDSVIDDEVKIWLAQIDKSKSEAVKKKIINGKLDKYYEENCLLRQRYIKDDQKTIEDMLNEIISKLGENIKIKEFSYIVI